MKARAIQHGRDLLRKEAREASGISAVPPLSLPLLYDAIGSLLGSWLHHSAVTDYAHPIWSFQTQIASKRNLQCVPRLAHLHVLKTKRPGLETNLVSRTGLRNPRETSQFAFRTITKTPPMVEKSDNDRKYILGIHCLNESPHPEMKK